MMMKMESLFKFSSSNYIKNWYRTRSTKLHSHSIIVSLLCFLCFVMPKVEKLVNFYLRKRKRLSICERDVLSFSVDSMVYLK